MNFIRASISIKELNINMLIKIHESERDETQSLFFQLEAINSLFVFLLIIANTVTSTLFLIILFHI